MSLLTVLNLRPLRRDAPAGPRAVPAPSGDASMEPAPPPRRVGDRESFVREVPPAFDPPAASALKETCRSPER